MSTVHPWFIRCGRSQRTDDGSVGTALLRPDALHVEIIAGDSTEKVRIQTRQGQLPDRFIIGDLHLGERGLFRGVKHQLQGISAGIERFQGRSGAVSRQGLQRA